LIYEYWNHPAADAGIAAGSDSSLLAGS